MSLGEQRVGHRRAGEAELTNRGDVGFREVGVVDDVVIERGDEVEVGDALRREQAEGAGHVEARQADEGATDHRHRKQRADAHRVIKWHDAERAFAVGVQVLRDVGDGASSFGAMAARDALRFASRAGGVEHQ